MTGVTVKSLQSSYMGVYPQILTLDRMGRCPAVGISLTKKFSHPRTLVGPLD